MTEANEMKTGAVKKTLMMVIYASISAAFGYSLMSLTAKPAYAASCNCTAESKAAEAFCEQEYGDPYVEDFVCSIDNEIYTYRCAAYPDIQWDHPCID
jgi:hypothetical protein